MKLYIFTEFLNSHIKTNKYVRTILSVMIQAYPDVLRKF